MRTRRKSGNDRTKYCKYCTFSSRSFPALFFSFAPFPPVPVPQSNHTSHCTSTKVFLPQSQTPASTRTFQVPQLPDFQSSSIFPDYSQPSRSSSLPKPVRKTVSQNESPVLHTNSHSLQSIFILFLFETRHALPCHAMPCHKLRSVANATFLPCKKYSYIAHVSSIFYSVHMYTFIVFYVLLCVRSWLLLLLSSLW